MSMLSDGSQIIHLCARVKLAGTETKKKKQCAVVGCWQGDAANQNLIECGTDLCFIVSFRRQEYSIRVR